MDQSQKISVILPVYNCEKFIYKSARSILEQSYKNIELIIVNDGSTDKSLFHLERLVKEDERVKLISRENKGFVSSLNEAIELASGDWVARMDADDISLAIRFERQMDFLEKNNADVCGSLVKRFGSYDNRVVKLPVSDSAIKLNMLFACPFAHPTILVKTSILRKHKYDEGFEVAGDYNLWVRLAIAGYKMVNIPEVLVLYRMHNEQLTVSKANKQRELSQKSRRYYWQHFIKNSNISQIDADSFLSFYEPQFMIYNMNAADNIFSELLVSNKNEARQCVLDHALRIYYKTASSTPDIVSRWKNLNRIAEKKVTYSSLLKLWILQKFNIKTESKIFSFLRKLHVIIINRT